MVSHPENGSDSPIGSDRDRGRDKIIFFLVFFFDIGFCKCTGRTSSKLDLSPDIDPTEISRILNQLP